LEESVFLGVDGGTVSIEVRDPYFKNFAERPEHLKMIQEIASQAFGRAVSVVISLPSSSESKDPAAKDIIQSAGEFENSGHEKTREEVKEAFVGDPMIQEVLSIFGGKVLEIRPRTS
jgi:hypothetical protein